ncbi:hypothetical protein BJY04DRAFT_72657 [Aspergillus karnatakaensis]|uniref:uncharacterized protein n=1 Tax=Aspergillus karnatakaensis TaxID=1810916 RepID=UPI003CCCCEE2
MVAIIILPPVVLLDAIITEQECPASDAILPDNLQDQRAALCDWQVNRYWSYMLLPLQCYGVMKSPPSQAPTRISESQTSLIAPTAEDFWSLES